MAGIIRDDAGREIGGAQVTLVGTRLRRAADPAGRFAFTSLPPGTYRVSVAALGFGGGRAEVAVRGGESSWVELTLVPTPLELSGVEVTASPLRLDPLSVARSVTQLSGRELERSLGPTIAQTLGSQAGIGVRYNGPAAGMPVLRGVTGDRILILQDGQRSSDLSGSADDHSMTIDPLAAQRIEVVRGPASLLHGGNALGGVINVMSEDIPERVPLRPTGAIAFHTETAFPGGSGSARVSIPVGERWAASLRGSARATGDVRTGADPLLGSRLANTAQRALSGGTGVAYLGERTRAGVAVHGYASEYGLPAPPDNPDRVVLDGRRLTASSRLEHEPGNAVLSEIRFQASATDYAHDELESGAVEMAFGLRTATADLLLRHDRIGPLAQGAFGVSGLARWYAATGEEQLTPPAESRALGLYAYQEVPIDGGRFSLQLGGRIDRHAISSRDEPAFGEGSRWESTALSGSAGLNLPLAEGISISLSGGRSYRAPTVEELFSNAVHLGTASFEIGDPKLSAEIAEGIDLVMRIARPHLKVEAASYRSIIAGFIHFVERGDTVVHGTTWPLLAYAQDRASFRGLEAQVEWAVLPTVMASLMGDVVQGRLAGGAAVPFLPAARTGASLRWERRSAAVGGGLRHAFARSGSDASLEAGTPSYTLIEGHAGLRFGRRGRAHSLQLRGENLANVLYRDAASRIKDFAPNSGRNVSLLYRIRF